MLDIKFIRENPEKVKQGAINKRFSVDIDRLLELDVSRRDLIFQADVSRSRRNEVAALIPKADAAQRPALIEEGKLLKEKIQDLEEKLSSVTTEYDALLLMVPNVALDEVPIGETDEDNVVVRHVGTPREMNFTPKDHEELGIALGILDKNARLSSRVHAVICYGVPEHCLKWP